MYPRPESTIKHNEMAAWEYKWCYCLYVTLFQFSFASCSLSLFFRFFLPGCGVVAYNITTATRSFLSLKISQHLGCDGVASVATVDATLK